MYKAPVELPTLHPILYHVFVSLKWWCSSDEGTHFTAIWGCRIPGLPACGLFVRYSYFFSTIFFHLQFCAMHLGVLQEQLLLLAADTWITRVFECLIAKSEIYFPTTGENNETPHLYKWKWGKTSWAFYAYGKINLTFFRSWNHCTRSRARSLRNFLLCLSEYFSALFSLKVTCKEKQNSLLIHLHIS